MNLCDLVKRRAAKFGGNKVCVSHEDGGQGKERCVVFQGRAVLEVISAHEFTCLEGLSRELGWVAWSTQGAADISIWMRLRGSKVKISLYASQISTRDLLKIRLSWPLEAANAEGFDLVSKAESAGDVYLSVGPTWSARKYLLSKVSGTGVEVSPGFNPGELSSDSVNVRYVENISAEEWKPKYGKDKEWVQLQKLCSDYVLCSAECLEVIEGESLDFIYSSHVFEHLVNPLGVLRNWHRKLKPDGIVLGIVPDCRYTFDCRQSTTTEREILDANERGEFFITENYLQRWVTYTAPEKSINSLRDAGYSVHVNLYTPSSFVQLLKLSSQELKWQFPPFLTSSLSAKDFDFLVRKSELGI